MDGFELAERIRKIRPGLPILYMSAYPEKAELRPETTRNIPFVLASGYGDWALPKSLRYQPRLTKPFRQHDLEQQVKLLLAKAGASIT